MSSKPHHRLPLTSIDAMHIGFGGAIGSTLRALLAVDFDSGFPLPTLAVNIIGAILIAILYAYNHHKIPTNYNFYMVGFCGSFTTVSLFSFETLVFLQEGNWTYAIANIFLPVCLGLAAAWTIIRFLDKPEEGTAK